MTGTANDLGLDQKPPGDRLCEAAGKRDAHGIHNPSISQTSGGQPFSWGDIRVHEGWIVVTGLLAWKIKYLPCITFPHSLFCYT